MKLGGAERIVNQLFSSLLSKEIDAKLLTLYYDQALANAVCLKSSSPYSLKAIVGIFRYCRKEVASDDLIHVHLFPASFYCAVLKQFGLIKGKLIFTEHSTSNNRRNKVWGKLLDRFIYKNYSRIIAISQGTADELIEWIPSLKPKIGVINNGSKHTFNQYHERPEKERLTIISVGNLRKAKNYQNALYAIADIKHLDIKYQIIGEGDEEEMLRTEIQKLQLSDKVELLGYKSNVQDYLKEADIFLMPSSYEGFGLAAVEAMNASLPSILSNVKGLRELYDEKNKNAILVEPDNPSEIADALHDLISSKELRLKMGFNAFQKSLSYSLDGMIDNYIQLYKELNGE